MKFHLYTVDLDDGSFGQRDGGIAGGFAIHQRICLSLQWGDEISCVAAVGHYGAGIAGKAETCHSAIQGYYAADMFTIDDLNKTLWEGFQITDDLVEVSLFRVVFWSCDGIDIFWIVIHLL